MLKTGAWSAAGEWKEDRHSPVVKGDLNHLHKPPTPKWAIVSIQDYADSLYRLNSLSLAST